MAGFASLGKCHLSAYVSWFGLTVFDACEKLTQKLENERLEQCVSCEIRSFPIATLRDETVSESSAHFELYLQFSYSPRRVGVLTFCTVVLLVVDYTEKGTFTPQVS